jgi:hypothetical protein
MTARTPFWEQRELERDGVLIEAAVQPAVSLALAHNEVPVVRSIQITNTSATQLADITVEIALDGRGRELAPRWRAALTEPLAPGAHQLLDRFDGFTPHHAELAGLDESHTATVSITVSHAWGPPICLSAGTRLLAHNEWFNAPLYYESLAAFVQPNTRSVASALGAAAELLRDHSGDASLQGYQAGPERASLIAAAVYETLRQRQIRYVDPPASFEDSGQKVRTTAQVLEDRLGTCVDLSVTYAACLEQAGLHPLVWLVEGHAFAGYMRDSTGLGQTVVTEPNPMVNLVESGRVVPVEAVFYDQGNDGTFAAAVAAAKRRFHNVDALYGVIDVYAAHRAGTRPLPSTDTVPVPEVPAAPAAGEARAALVLPEELRTRADEDDVLLHVEDYAPPRVRQWKRALLDLSTRNRLLNLRPSAEVIDLHVPAGSLPLLDDLIHAGKPMMLLPQDELSELQRLQGARRAQDLDAELLHELLRDERRVFIAVTEQVYVNRMRRLQRTARTMLEETGNANLYLTLGALVHRTPSGKDARAPLFLLPVKIEGGGGRSAFQIRVDAANVASPNHCLVEWLRIKHDVRIDALETPPLDRSGIDVAAALPAIRDALVEHRLDVRIDEIATVAICQFSTYGMWRDLEVSWDTLALGPVAEHLALRPGESFRDPAAGDDGLDAVEVDEAETPLPIPADGSQLRAVTLAAAGRSFVLEGPPGTGKSQTITNLVAHAMAEGKSILFVAEKQAALDVVKRRLVDVGLADFTLDLHGRSQRPAEIRAQLKRAIDNQATYDRRGWEAICARLRARHAPLAEYPERVHEPNAIGVTLWGAVENLLQYGEGPTASIPAAYVASRHTDEAPIKDGLRAFARAARSVGLRPHHPWALVGSVDDALDPDALAAATAALEAARLALVDRPDAMRLLEAVDGPAAIGDFLPVLEDRASGRAPDAARLAHVRSAAWRSARQQLYEDVDAFAAQHAAVVSTFTQTFLEHGETDALARAAEQAQRGLFGKRRRIEAFQETVGGLLLPGVSLEPRQVPGILIGVDAARTHAADLVEQAREVFGGDLPRGWTPLRANARAPLDAAGERLDRSDRIEQRSPELFRLITDSEPMSADAIATLRDVADAWARLTELLATGEEERALWLGDRHWLVAWADAAPDWTRDVTDAADAAVRRWARMAALLDPLRAAGLTELRSELLAARLDAADAEVAYLRGIATTSLRERRDAAGLRAFDAALRDGEIADYADAAAAARKEQRVALPAALLERRPYRGDRLSGRVAELRRRLDAKRGGLTFRQLIERYGEEILAATPCFFVSPASLAQYVPPGAVTFDLVVFDEASQVTVAQAIGALGRGRSAVIVGDSQQMPPTSVGKAKHGESDVDDDDEADTVEDLESILSEAVESGLPRVWLSWHYRSQDESLIAFSNAHYYEDRLASLPAPGGDATSGLELRRVQGHFNREDSRREHRTNRVEAEAIVAEIREILADPRRSDQSIGVVTFNSQQRDLVLNLLEDCGDPLVERQLREDAREGIFVKNLENVQGDERDVVLFSVAFSKRLGGGPLPMNFGPLGNTGGEKRLNVAITRARRKVIIFASIDPSDIDLSRTSSQGIAHLRSYLELAAAGPGVLAAHRPPSVIGVDHVREAIATAVRARGYVVETDFGLSDFKVDLVVRAANADRWQVAIVLDGPRWAQRPTVADRDLTPLLLRDLMRWGASMRIWVPEWIDDPARVLDRVGEAVEAARATRELEERQLEAAVAERERSLVVAATSEEGPAEDDFIDDDALEVETFTFLPADADADAEPADEVEFDPNRVAEQPATRVVGDAAGPPPATIERDMHARGAPYVEAVPTPLGTRADLDRTGALIVRRAIATAVRETVAIEGPILTARLARSIGRRFGFDRVAAGRQRFILATLPPELVRASEFGDFVWPPELDPKTWRGFRSTPPELDRPLSEVAPEEIINAMAAAAADQYCANDEALFRATLATFGQRRLTGPTTARLEACRDLAVSRSRLIRTERGAWRAGA